MAKQLDADILDKPKSQIKDLVKHCIKLENDLGTELSNELHNKLYDIQHTDNPTIFSQKCAKLNEWCTDKAREIDDQQKQLNPKTKGNLGKIQKSLDKLGKSLEKIRKYVLISIKLSRLDKNYKKDEEKLFKENAPLKDYDKLTNQYTTEKAKLEEKIKILFNPESIEKRKEALSITLNMLKANVQSKIATPTAKPSKGLTEKEINQKMQEHIAKRPANWKAMSQEKADKLLKDSKEKRK
ncbi:MAG: hypothetical protein HRU35_08300 [Rickettsiaceae bacterium]|nr:hypothetical protein [Rickettsiaceae bacterium]